MNPVGAPDTLPVQADPAGAGMNLDPNRATTRRDSKPRRSGDRHTGSGGGRRGIQPAPGKMEERTHAPHTMAGGGIDLIGTSARTGELDREAGPKRPIRAAGRAPRRLGGNRGHRPQPPHPGPSGARAPAASQGAGPPEQGRKGTDWAERYGRMAPGTHRDREGMKQIQRLPARTRDRTRRRGRSGRAKP